MTCNAEYSQGGTASFVQINNLYGDSLAAESGENVAWNAVGDASTVARNLFEQDDGIAPGGGYTSTYTKKKEYWQACSAIALMYETINGEDVDEDLNERYWKAKNGQSSSIETGYRTWANASSSTVDKFANSSAISYTLWDFGIEEPERVEVEESESNERCVQ